MKILVVEDEPKVVDIIRNHFVGQGHEVFSSETGQGALDLLERHRPDLMLLDLWLKDAINGLAVLKERPRLSAKTTVIVMTGLEDSSQDELVSLGAAALMRKPVRLEELSDLVTHVSANEEEPPREA